MTSVDAGVRCSRGHSFDRARHGHLTLFGPRGRRFRGDTADQVAARDRVLRSGLFDGVAGALVDAALHDAGPGDAAQRARSGRTPAPVLVEAGAGTGFYLDRVVDAVHAVRPEGADPSGHASGTVLGVGTEISAAAARRLARSNPLVAALVADTWDRLPLAESSVDLLQVVFAPRNPSEFARVLRPGGSLVVAVPGDGHLEPLRGLLGMLEPAADKGDRLDADLVDEFEPVRVRRVDVSETIPPATAVDLALMGPSGVHLDRARVEEELGRDATRVRLHVEVRSYRALQQ